MHKALQAQRSSRATFIEDPLENVTHNIVVLHISLKSAEKALVRLQILAHFSEPAVQAP